MQLEVRACESFRNTAHERWLVLDWLVAVVVRVVIIPFYHSLTHTLVMIGKQCQGVGFVPLYGVRLRRGQIEL